MLFLKLILTNLSSHRVRTGISMAGIAFSVAAMLTVVTILQGAVGMFSGLLSTDSEVIVFERNVSDLVFSNVPDSVAEDLRQSAMVQRSMPVLFGVVASLDHPIITCFGVVPEDSRIRNAEWLGGSPENFGKSVGQVTLGERAAEFLNVKQGQEVAIGNGTFHVSGVIRTKNGFEDGGVFMPIKEAQTFFHKEGTSSVVSIKLRRKDDSEHLVQEIKKKYPNLIALKNEDFDRSYSQFKILTMTAWAVGGCGLLLGGLGVANTMIMSVFTRIRELAILRVNGFSNRQIGGMILGESAIVSFLGAIVGLLAGGVLILVLKLIPSLHGYINAQLDLRLIVAVVLLACITGIAGALYPALYAIRIRAVEALRFE
jgi:putative ABC transport system permease protein